MNLTSDEVSVLKLWDKYHSIHKIHQLSIIGKLRVETALDFLIKNNFISNPIRKSKRVLITAKSPDGEYTRLFDKSVATRISKISFCSFDNKVYFIDPTLVTPSQYINPYTAIKREIILPIPNFNIIGVDNPKITINKIKVYFTGDETIECEVPCNYLYNLGNSPKIVVRIVWEMA